MFVCLRLDLKLRINVHFKATKKASRIVIKSTLLPPLRNSYSRDQKDELVSHLISDVNASKLLKSENYMVGLQQTIKSINSKKAEIVLIGKDLDFFACKGKFEIFYRTNTTCRFFLTLKSNQRIHAHFF